MKVEVIIEKINKATADISAPTIYEYKGRKRVLVNQNEMKSFDPYAKDIPPTSDVQFKGVNPKLFYVYEVEPKDEKGSSFKGVTPEDDNKMRVVDEFWRQHPMTQINGVNHANTKHAMFNVIDVPKMLNDNVDEWESIRKIANFLAEANDSVLSDITYWYGGTPVDKTRQALLMEIGSFKGGRATANREAIRSFIENWVAPTDSSREVKMNANKAVSMGLITLREDGGRSSYYFGNEFIGTTIDDVIAFFKREEKIYKESIVRRIIEKDPSAKISQDSEMQTKLRASGTAEDAAVLIEKIKELKKAGMVDPTYAYKNKSIDDLKKVIFDAENAKTT